MSFLGHVIFREGVGVDPEKVKAVVEWTRPISDKCQNIHILALNLHLLIS
jgi:hypothetical protein